jgi:hypothetical protein
MAQTWKVADQNLNISESSTRGSSCLDQMKHEAPLELTHYAQLLVCAGGPAGTA